MMCIKFLLLLLSVFVGYVLGYLFTETDKFDLQRWRILDFKLFKCRPCLTFHISWVLSTFLGCIFEDKTMIGIGVGFAFGLFILLKNDEKERFIE